MADADRINVAIVEENDFGVTPPTTRAQGTLTVDTQPTAGDTMTIDSRTYTFRAALTGADDEILIGGSLADTQANIVAAINNTGNNGVQYQNQNTIHPTVSMGAFAANNSVLTSKFGGVVGNAIATTETFTAGTNVFDAATLGTTTAGVGTTTLEQLRLTSESLVQDTDTAQSQEIRDDRQINDILRTNIAASGDIGFELSFLGQETLMKAALFAQDFSSSVTDVTADTGIEADGTLNEYRGALNEFSNYSVGEWVRVTGFANAANNGYAKIIAITTTSNADDTIQVEGLSLVTEAAGASVNIHQMGSIVNGTVQKSFSIEKRFTDVNDTVQAYRGMHVSTFDLTAAVEAIITGSFGFVGKNATAENFPIGSGYTPAPTKDIMTAVDDVLQVIEDGTLDAQGNKDCATQISFSIDNNLRARACIGVLGAISVGVGSFNVSGTIQRYFESNDQMEKYLNFDRTSLAFVLRDGEGNAYVIEFPSIKFTAGASVAGGQNTDIIADLTWEAHRDSVDGYTMKIAKLAA